MSTDIYKNKKIKIESISNNTVLHIDDSRIEYSLDADTKRYFAYDILPYQKFASLQDLARAIIDKQTERGGN